MNAYGSHFSILRQVVLNTTNSILECGLGYFSTPMLHVLCSPNRPLYSADNDKQWVNQFQFLANEYHNVFLVEDWLANGKLLKPWGLVFVDCAPESDRAPLIIRLRKKTLVFVAHDSDSTVGKLSKLIDTFRSVWRSDDYPQTAVFSDNVLVDSLCIASSAAIA